MAVEGTRASAVPYFYGRISRDEAETILSSNGCKEGLYLLRENVSTAGNYALSICHHNRYTSETLFIPTAANWLTELMMMRIFSEECRVVTLWMLFNAKYIVLYC